MGRCQSLQLREEICGEEKHVGLISKDGIESHERSEDNGQKSESRAHRHT